MCFLIFGHLWFSLSLPKYQLKHTVGGSTARGPDDQVTLASDANMPTPNPHCMLQHPVSPQGLRGDVRKLPVPPGSTCSRAMLSNRASSLPEPPSALCHSAAAWDCPAGGKWLEPLGSWTFISLYLMISTSAFPRPCGCQCDSRALGTFTATRLPGGEGKESERFLPSQERRTQHSSVSLLGNMPPG